MRRSRFPKQFPAREPDDGLTDLHETTNRKGSANESIHARTILFLVLLVAIGLRAWGIAGKSTLSHDEAISYLAATGHQGEFQNIVDRELPPYGVWARAYDWNRLTQPEDWLCFGRIARDLGANDIHPPLYFWCLHIWSVLFGVHLWTGPLLNTAIVCFSIFALFGLARYVLQHTLLAGMVVLVWSVSPNVLMTTLEARQYDLLALVSILLVWRILVCMDASQPLTKKRLATVGLITCCGLLTHYHFPILLLACGLIAVREASRTGFHRLAKLALVVTLGALLFAALQPKFAHQIERARNQRSTNIARHGKTPQRIDRVVERYAAFFIDGKTLPENVGRRANYVVLSVGLSLIGLAFIASRRKQGSTDAATISQDRKRSILFLLLWTAGANIFLYIACYSPQHAMAHKYPAMVWPWFAFLPAIVAHRFPRGGLMVGWALTLIVLLAGVHRIRMTNQQESKFGTPESALKARQQLIVDTARRGWLLRVVWFCPDAMPVLAARPDFLIRTKEAWLGQVGAGTVYVSPNAPGMTPNKRRQIAMPMAERFQMLVWRKLFWNLGSAYDFGISPKASYDQTDENGR